MQERRHKTAEVAARVVSTAIECVRDEVTILSNAPSLPQILREQRAPVRIGAFVALEVLTPIVFGVLSWIYLDNPIPGVILGAYLPIRRVIAQSVL